MQGKIKVIKLIFCTILCWLHTWLAFPFKAPNFSRPTRSIFMKLDLVNLELPLQTDPTRYEYLVRANLSHTDVIRWCITHIDCSDNNTVAIIEAVVFSK